MAVFKRSFYKGDTSNIANYAMAGSTPNIMPIFTRSCVIYKEYFILFHPIFNAIHSLTIGINQYIFTYLMIRNKFLRKTIHLFIIILVSEFIFPDIHFE